METVVRDFGDDPNVVVTWGIDVLDDFSGAVFTLYRLREGATGPRDADPMPPLLWTTERLEQLQRELPRLIETLKTGASRPRPKH